MLSTLRARMTYANVTSTLCLFLVLGGGTAVALNGHNTVFSDDITNGEVKKADIGSGAVSQGKFFLSAGETFDFGSVGANSCSANAFDGATYADVTTFDDIFVTAPEALNGGLVAYAQSGSERSTWCSAT